MDHKTFCYGDQVCQWRLALYTDKAGRKDNHKNHRDTQQEKQRDQRRQDRTEDTVHKVKGLTSHTQNAKQCKISLEEAFVDDFGTEKHTQDGGKGDHQYTIDLTFEQTADGTEDGTHRQCKQNRVDQGKPDVVKHKNMKHDFQIDQQQRKVYNGRKSFAFLSTGARGSLPGTVILGRAALRPFLCRFFCCSFLRRSIG